MTVNRCKTAEFIANSTWTDAKRQRRRAALTISIACAVSLLASLTSTAQAGERELQAFVVKKAATISTIHNKAKRALANAAQDRAFADYYMHHDHEARHNAKKRIEEVSLATQSRFHVEEMCLIDAAGPEVTRIVGNAIAPDSELSPDESAASFFKSGFGVKPRHVHIARPYMSPDANKWVLAYVTPVVARDQKKAILHYEHGLDVYRDAVNNGMNGDDRYLLIISEGGHVISDSRVDLDITRQGDKEDPADYFPHIRDLSPKGLVNVYQGIDAVRSGVSRISADGVDYGVAYAVVEGGLTLFAVERF